MKLYRTSTANESTRGKWSGSQAEAASDRKALNQAGHKRDSITTDEFDVPTDKKGLLAWLNERGE